MREIPPIEDSTALLAGGEESHAMLLTGKIQEPVTLLSQETCYRRWKPQVGGQYFPALTVQETDSGDHQLDIF